MKRKRVVKEAQSALFAAISAGAYEEAFALLKENVPVNIRNAYGRTPLFEAVASGKDRMVQLLLMHKADPNYPNLNGLTPFYKAVDTCNVAIAHTLLEAKALITKNVSLRRAVESGDYRLVKGCIGSGVSGDYEELIGIAVKVGVIAVLRLVLIQRKHDLSNVNGMKNPPLVDAVQRGDFESVKLLVEYGADVNTGSHWTTPLKEAVSINRVDIMKFLIALGANVEEMALQTAAYHGAVEAARFLIEEHGIVPTISILETAIEKRQSAIIALLAQHITDINMVYAPEDHCLVTAVKKHHVQAVKLLLEREDLDAAHKKEAFWTALKKQNPEIIQLFYTYLKSPWGEELPSLTKAITTLNLAFIAEHISDTALKEQDGEPLWYAATGLKDRDDIVRLLLEKGATPSMERKGTSLLRKCVRKRHMKVARVLIEYGADIHEEHNNETLWNVARRPRSYLSGPVIDINPCMLLLEGIRNADKAYVLLAAVAAQDVQKVEAMLKDMPRTSFSTYQDCLKVAGEKRNHAITRLLEAHVKPLSPNLRLYRAVREGDVVHIRRALEEGANANMTTDYFIASSQEEFLEVPLLFIAVDKGMEEVVQCLLAAKEIDIKKKSKAGWTALHWAVVKNHHNIVQCLIAHGASLADVPFFLAASAGNIPVMQAMLENGRDINEKNNGTLPIAYAVQRRSLEAVQFLLKYGAELPDAVLEEAVMASIKAKNSHLPLLQLLLEHSGATPSLIMQVLRARNYDNREAVHATMQLLLMHCVEIDAAFEQCYRSGYFIPLFVRYGAKVPIEVAVKCSKDSAAVKRARNEMAQELYHPVQLLEVALEYHAPVEIVHMLLQDIKEKGKDAAPKDMPQFLAKALGHYAPLDSIKLLIEKGYKVESIAKIVNCNMRGYSCDDAKNILMLTLTQYDTSSMDAFLQALPAELSQALPEDKHALYVHTLCLKPLMPLVLSAQEALYISDMLSSHKELLLKKGQEIAQLEKKVLAYIGGYQSLRSLSNVAKNPLSFKGMHAVEPVVIEAMVPSTNEVLSHVEKLKLWEVMKSPHNTTATSFFKGLLACLAGEFVGVRGASVGMARAS